MTRETTAAWIQEEMELVFHRYPKADVDRAYPVLLLLMARDFGLNRLRPILRRRVVTLLHNLGIGEGSVPEDAEARVAAFVESLDVDEAILRDVKQIFDTHYSALGELSAGRFLRKILARRTILARRHGDARPEGSVSGGDLARSVIRQIRA